MVSAPREITQFGTVNLLPYIEDRFTLSKMNILPSRATRIQLTERRYDYSSLDGMEQERCSGLANLLSYSDSCCWVSKDCLPFKWAVKIDV